MSFLAPLFFAAAAAIAAPILFHLIRREPKGRIDFSSLMFIKPSPPRVTRRSRLDNWLLLLLRALAILLVAAAFTRPFLRTFSETTTRRPSSFVVILVDQSASMQREDLWQQAVTAVENQIDELDQYDRFAVATFDQEVDVIREMRAKGEDDPQIAIKQLRSQTPTWMQSDLGTALAESVELIDETMRSADEAEAERLIIVVSDMQESSRLESLRGLAWPESTRVRLVPVAPKSTSNVSLVVSSKGLDGSSLDAANVPSSSNETKAGGEETEQRFYRVKISNAENSEAGRFDLHWLDENLQRIKQSAKAASLLQSINVPPGTNRVINLPAPEDAAIALEISGDQQAYDNQYFLVIPPPQQQKVLMIGGAASDPRDSLYYYLEKLPLSRPGTSVEPQLLSATEFAVEWDQKQLVASKIPFVIINQFPQADSLDLLEQYLITGGRVLVVIDQKAASDPATQEAVRRLANDPALITRPAEVQDYALLNRIDFSSEVFRPLADPRFSDFTKIQFWQHAVVDLPSRSADASESQTEQATERGKINVLANFDSGTPALLEQRIGTGRLFVLATGWQPNESQLALSTKFVPIISGFLGKTSRTADWESLVIGQSSQLPTSATAELVLPDGTVVALEEPADLQQIDRPGVYRWRDGETVRRFAVNLSASESDSGVMDRSVLEQLGVVFEDEKKEAVLQAGERQKRDAELEQQQSIWRWLLVSALGLIGLETLLSSRRKQVVQSS